MDTFRVPLNPTWYNSSHAVCTPDDGFLYICNIATIVYIAPIVKDQRSEVINLQHLRTLLALDCDLDWSTTKYFAIFDEDNNVCVWDLNHRVIVLSHCSHCISGSNPKRSIAVGGRNPRYGKKGGLDVDGSTAKSGALCFIKSRHLISNSGNGFVKLCLASGTFTTFTVSPVFVKDTITIMRGSPYDANIMAVGTKRGLVMVIDIHQKATVYKLRGHDEEVTSLDWMKVCSSSLMTHRSVASLPCTPNRPKLQAKTAERMCRGPPVPIIDSNDAFDIYEYDDCADEFGASARPANAVMLPEPLAADKKPEPIEVFDYVEACKNLVNDILQSVTPETSADGVPGTEDETVSLIDFGCDKSAVNLPATPCQTEHVEQEPDKTTNILCEHASSDESYVNIVENPLELTTYADADLMNESMDAKDRTKSTTYLASGSREASIWIWNIDTGVGEHKIELPRATKTSPLPYTFTMLCWINETTLLANTPNGDIVWCEISITSGFKLVSKLKSDLFVDRAVTGLHKCTPRLDGQPPYMWSKSLFNQLICTRITDGPEVLACYSTLPMGMQSIVECPHDYTKIAVAGTGRRVNLLSLSTLSPNNVQISCFTNRVQSKVLYLAWHPINENLLAYSTEEGRVAIIDVSNSSNMPVIMKPFSGKAVYQISWAQLCNETDNTKRIVLFACSNNRLVYFPESGESKHSPVQVHQDLDISAVSAGKDYLALGTSDGHCIIYSLKDIKKVAGFKKLFTKYVSECAWNRVRPTKLAVSCAEAGIFVLDCVSPTEIQIVGELVGHKGVPYVKWSNESEHKLVSTGFDGTVRVWDVASLTCTSLYQFSAIMFTAMFMPSDENFILCSGRYETLYIYDSRLHMHAKKSIKDLPKRFADDSRIATLIETDTSKLAAAEKKKNKRYMAKRSEQQNGGDGDDVDTLCEAMNDIDVHDENDDNEEYSEDETGESEASEGVCVSVGQKCTINGGRCHKRLTREAKRRIDAHRKLIKRDTIRQRTNSLRELSGSRAVANNFAPICKMSASEFTVAPLKHLKILASNPTDSKTLNAYLFSTRERCLELLNIELKEHHYQQTNSVAYVLVPQLNGDLKGHIEQQIKTKALTRETLALAPMVSYPFWKRCCSAYAEQIIEKGCPLQAIPFLLASQDEDRAICALCDGGYFREAYIVAKLHKENEDPALQNILSKWANNLKSNGNFEGLALFEMLQKRPAAAVKALNERRSMTADAQEIVDILTNKLSQ